jgi:hypothetical protein
MDMHNSLRESGTIKKPNECQLQQTSRNHITYGISIQASNPHTCSRSLDAASTHVFVLSKSTAFVSEEGHPDRGRYHRLRKSSGAATPRPGGLCPVRLLGIRKEHSAGKQEARSPASNAANAATASETETGHPTLPPSSPSSGAL